MTVQSIKLVDIHDRDRPTIRYDTRCYFNVRSKSDMSQLNLYRTETTTRKCKTDKKLSYRRVTARCVLSVVILQITTQQCRNYLYDKS